MKKEVNVEKKYREFYNFMKKLGNLKRKLTKKLISGKKINGKEFENLKKALWYLEDVVNEEVIDNLYYEIDEIGKDIMYINEGENNLIEYISKKDEGFEKEVRGALSQLEGKKIDLLITDRDGTINNYCARYKTSIQSIYNAVLLSKFMRGKKALILSSAPLDLLREVSILPEKEVLLAGSEGREILFKNKIKKYPLGLKEKKLIQKIKTEIRKILSKKEYKRFSLIGSGFQEKHGLITVARQNISNSIKENESNQFLKKIKEIVNKHNKDKLISVHDTGLDIEIKIKKDKNIEFNKGEGLEFIKNIVNLKGNILACGDSAADLYLIGGAKKLDPMAPIIFVTKDEGLKKVIKKIDENTIFVSSPDALVVILSRLGLGEKNNAV